MDVPRHLEDTINELLDRSLATSSRVFYNKAWEKFSNFVLSLGPPSALPAEAIVVNYFIAHLKYENVAASSAQSHLSVIAFLHKINGFPDPTKSFITSKIMAGYRNTSQSTDIRLPITVPILNRLLLVARVIIPGRYDQLLLRAMMTLAFRGYLRVGEMVPSSQTGSDRNCLLVDDVKLEGDFITIIFRSFKHSSRQGAQSIRIDGSLIPGSSVYPAQHMREYLSARGDALGLLFTRPTCRYIRRNFDNHLRQMLNSCRLSTSTFKGHSFRIGAASYDAHLGKSDAYIRNAGRWVSDAFRKYIRLS